VVEHLPSKPEALSSNSNAAKNKNKKPISPKKMSLWLLMFEAMPWLERYVTEQPIRANS
jgi:hypothetical protein